LITVTGYIDNGIAYSAQIDPDAAPDEIDGIITHASPADRVTGVVRAHEGEQVMLALTGPAAEVSMTDALGILGALQEYTDVTAIEGDLPDGYPESDPNTDY
jgi:hypothetical protein